MQLRCLRCGPTSQLCLDVGSYACQVFKVDISACQRSACYRLPIQCQVLTRCTRLHSRFAPGCLNVNSTCQPPCSPQQCQASGIKQRAGHRKTPHAHSAVLPCPQVPSCAGRRPMHVSPPKPRRSRSRARPRRQTPQSWGSAAPSPALSAWQSCPCACRCSRPARP